jgi:Zn-dependent alcohol dehydrogenase
VSQECPSSAFPKEAKAREMGATDFVHSSGGTDPVAAVRGLTGGLGVDYALDSDGLATPVEQPYDIKKKGGTCVVTDIMRPDGRARRLEVKTRSRSVTGWIRASRLAFATRLPGG